MNKKNNNKTIIIVMSLMGILIIIVSIFIIRRDSYKKEKNIIKTNYIDEKENRTNIEDEQNVYIDMMKKAAANETNGEPEKVIITIKDNTNKEYNITNKDIGMIKEYEAKENYTEESIIKETIEYKIYSAEAQKLGITLTEEDLAEIEVMVNSEKILNYIQGNDIARNNFKERRRNYLLDVKYSSALQRKIIEEINNKNILINDEVINSKMKQYIKNDEEFLKIENPTYEDIKKSTKESYSLALEIKNLYLKKIEENYTVEYK